VGHRPAAGQTGAEDDREERPRFHSQLGGHIRLRWPLRHLAVPIGDLQPTPPRQGIDALQGLQSAGDVRTARRHKGAPPLLPDEQPAVLEGAQGFAQGGPGDAQLAGQRRLRREPIAGGVAFHEGFERFLGLQVQGPAVGTDSHGRSPYFV
jgi:hypothetical protein